MNVLVTCAGRRVELIRLLQGLNVGKVFAGDQSASAPALYEADGALLLPSLDDPGFLPELMSLCVTAEIDVVIPTIDPELELLASAQDALTGKGVRPVVSGADGIRACLDKLRVAAALANAGLPTVPTASWTGDDVALHRGGLVVKPRWGSSSRGFRIVKDVDELGHPPQAEQYVIQPFVDAPEVTIDAVAAHERIVAIGARRRLKVRGGEIERGVTVDARRFLPLAVDISRVFRLGGPFNFQVFDTPTKILISDINPRLGGGVPLSQRAGAPILEAILGLPLGPPIPMLAQPGIVMMRYDASIYRTEEELLKCPR